MPNLRDTQFTLCSCMCINKIYTIYDVQYIPYENLDIGLFTAELQRYILIPH